MAIYCAVACQRDFERSLNIGSDSSLDDITMRPEGDIAGVHAPSVVERSDSGASSRSVPPSWCRPSYSCPVHHSLQNSHQTAPSVSHNHHRNCSRAHLHQNPSNAAPSTDSNSNLATPLEAESDKRTRWAFPRIVGMSGVRSRTAELGYRALWSVISDFLPWIIGSYIIFQAFKYGMLELGLAAFLLMLSVHGVLKWCNARGKDKQEERLTEYETEAQVDSLCRQHHHHHYRQDQDSDSEFSSSDDSDLVDDAPSIGKVVIVMNEPPPPYDVVSRTTAQDLELDLQVHLTPRHPRVDQKDHSVMSENIYPEEDGPETGELVRSPVVSYTSCMSSEMDDDSLPSYSDAVKRIKRKKKRSQRSRMRRGENACSAEDEALFRALNYKDFAKIGDIASTTSDETPSEVLQNSFESTSNNSACFTVVREIVQDESINNESTLLSRENFSEMNSLLDVDSTYNSFGPRREPYM